MEGGLGVEKNINSGGDVSAVNLKASNSLQVSGSTSGNISLKAPSVVTSHDLIFPSVQGVSQSFLKNDGSGNLTWQELLPGSSENPLIEINKAGLTSAPYFASSFEELNEYNLSTNIIDILI